MNLILCDDDKVFLNKLEIRIRGLCQKHKIAVKMECYVSAKEMLEGISKKSFALSLVGCSNTSLGVPFPCK